VSIALLRTSAGLRPAATPIARPCCCAWPVDGSRSFHRTPAAPPCELSSIVLYALPDQLYPGRDVPRRDVLLIVVASASAAVAEGVAARLRHDGSVVYIAHSAEGCLRVATSISPDIVLLDPALPPRLESLLRAHPASARAEILHLETPAVRVPRPLRSSKPTADPHAA
jgi:hypothetical protein